MSALEGTIANLPSTLSFSVAFETIIQGCKLRRAAWPAGSWVALHWPDGRGMMTEPYIYMSMPSGNVPWAPSQQDMMATDWEVVKESS